MVSIEAHGVDVGGGDIPVGLNRNPRKPAQRCDAIANRARIIDELTKVDTRATRLGRTGVDPAQSYGNIAVGADDQTIYRQTQNMAIGAGKGLRKGASTIIAIE